MINNIKSWSHRLRSRFGYYKLVKELKHLKREHRFINIAEARRIGVLFDGSDEAALKEIHKYIQSLAGRDREIITLGYWNRKDIPDNPIRKLGYNYFTKKNISWLLIPNDTQVKEFTYTNFDILICINAENCFPLQYITAMSKATMRVGRYEESNIQFYDLMINHKGEDLKGYFREMDHYLNIINSKNA